MTYNPIPPANQLPEIVKQFEPARAVLRPHACDGRDGCWVKEGSAGYNHCDNRRTCCAACDGSILGRGLKRAHAAAIIRCAASAP